MWGKKNRSLYNLLREFVINGPVLAYPDPLLQFILDTDASLGGVGTLLSQIQGDEEKPIAYSVKL